MVEGLTSKTPIKLTIGAGVSLIAFLVGVQPWAESRVRAVVRGELQSAGLTVERLVTTEQLERLGRAADRELTKELVEIKLEVRGLREEVTDLRKGK